MLEQKAFEVLNRRTKIKLTDKVALLHDFLKSNLGSFSNSPVCKEMMDTQTSVKSSRKSSCDQVYCATKLTAMRSKHKKCRASSVRCARGRPGCGTFAFFTRLEDVLDALITQFDSGKEVESECDRRR